MALLALRGVLIDRPQFRFVEALFNRNALSGEEQLDGVFEIAPRVRVADRSDPLEPIELSLADIVHAHLFNVASKW